MEKIETRKKVRCLNCNKKLAVIIGGIGKLKIELKCPRCKKIETIKGGANGKM